VARLHDVVFDSRHPVPLARFWAAVLDGYAVAPYDDAEIERLRGLGIDDIDDDPSVMVEAESGAGPRLCFQRIDEAKTVKNRVHLDLRTDDLDREVARLVSLGARVAARPRAGWVVLVDPEGNEFCVSS
jgi:Glyoxalase-like domain